MRINGQAECFQFIRNAGLINLCPELAAFNNCMEEMGRMCNCDPESVRRAKVDQCKTIYSNFVSIQSNNFKNQLLSKVADNCLDFWIDGRHLSTICR